MAVFTAASPSPDELVVLGQISGVHGVRGWLKVFSFTQPRDNILRYSHWYLKIGSQWVKVKLKDGKDQPGRAVIVLLDQVSSRDDVQNLIGADIAVLQSDLPPLGDDEFYWQSLMGARVINTQDQVLGVLTEVADNGVHEIIRVEGDHTYLIPYVDNHVLDVDQEGQWIRVDWHLEDIA